MGISKKLKNKLFPDEKDTLYYGEFDVKTSKKKEPKIKTFVPTSFSETEIIAKELRNFNDVTVDVVNLDKRTAMRMIDFLGGVMFALNGDMIKNSKTEFTFKVKK